MRVLTDWPVRVNFKRAISEHDDVIKWKHFPRYWPFVRGIHRSPHKDQRHRALMFSLICAWTNRWVNSREAGDLRRHQAHYDANGMTHAGHGSPYILLVKLLSGEWQRTHLTIHQHWFRYWFGAIRQQAVTWANFDPDLCRHMASLGYKLGPEKWSTFSHTIFPNTPFSK